YAIANSQQINQPNLKPGTRIIHEGFPGVVTVDGILILTEVHPEGKKPMKGSDFLRGARGWEA
ncbi:MAG: hypothetical protein ACNA8H_06400, partial [Anaerolineales bacterium]